MQNDVHFPHNSSKSTEKILEDVAKYLNQKEEYLIESEDVPVNMKAKAVKKTIVDHISGNNDIKLEV